MPKIRNRGGVPDNHRSGIDSYGGPRGTTVRSQAFPDVPLNPQHRFCTPPPLDPQYATPVQAEKDDFPQFTSRPPSPDDFDELTGARAPLPPLPGSKANPIVIEDDFSESSRRSERRNATDAVPRRRTTASLRPISSTSQGRSSQPAATPTQGTVGNSSRKPSTKVPKLSTSPEVVKKTIHGYSPTKSSPLSKVAYKAPSASPTLPPQYR
ncbi:hypothetical protein L226DRAFT_570781 [Lentinus tigrinus ALCF2SS1-7]|uniref:Uncharacterized protein n=1 Tax=Lentinus tigrinus ALCF2SS1-6 TaxID=1328759 RepID=A0A5C2SBB2_9APHY|nr:hypothetical protein L227DRAFT_652823 [Lentinus tigrinus ALCF2SS1-6]RPD75117.1 hypothetical protein L226DRAFT_570781 [Lentinus tigrinus ALCF2SS1-7]